MSTRRAGPAMLALAVIAAGCASSGPVPRRVGPADRALEGLLGRRCVYAASELGVPSFAELTRPGTRGSIALWGRDMTGADTVDLSIRYDDEGGLEWVAPIGGTLTAEAAEDLAAHVLRGVAETGPEDWGVRVRFVAGDVAGVEPSVVCEPKVRQRRDPAELMPPTSIAYRQLYSVRGRPFRVRLELGARGEVRGARLLGVTGYPIIDQFILDVAHTSIYAPKLHDGIGTSTTWVTTIRIPTVW